MKKGTEMKTQKIQKKWYKLDAFAKTYSSIISEGRTTCFRLSVLLSEEIDVGLLKKAALILQEKYPFYNSELKKGIFWNYLQHKKEDFQVEPENTYPCTDIKKKNPLRIIYYRKKISVEIAHFLTDGVGAAEFLKDLTEKYLNLKYFSDNDNNKDDDFLKDSENNNSKSNNRDSFLENNSNNANNDKDNNDFSKVPKDSENNNSKSNNRDSFLENNSNNANNDKDNNDFSKVPKDSENNNSKSSNKNSLLENNSNNTNNDKDNNDFTKVPKNNENNNSKNNNRDSFLKNNSNNANNNKNNKSVKSEENIINSENTDYVDLYSKYMRKVNKEKTIKSAFHLPIKILEKGQYHITTGEIALESIKKESEKYNTTVGKYLLAVYFKVLLDKYPNIRKQIVIGVPVDLRKIFSEKTYRNFFINITPSIDPSLGSYSLEEIIEYLKNYFKMKVTKKEFYKSIYKAINPMRNIFVKSIPYFIKRIFYPFVFDYYGEKGYTTGFSNLGILKMDEKYFQYIKGYRFLPPPSKRCKIKIGIISNDEKVYLTFGNLTTNHEIERDYFIYLRKRGIRAKISVNY